MTVTIRRRELLAALGGAAAAWPLAARAQQAPKMLRVGTVSAQPRSASVWMAFEQRMVELGYEQGKNFALEIVPAASTQGFERGYRELAARNIDIVLASGPEIALKSALAAVRSLPIVMIAIEYDPLALGYVTSLARPGGNVTGLFFQQIELAMKRVQLMKDAFQRPASRDRVLGCDIRRPVAGNAKRRGNAWAAGRRNRVAPAAL